jgi:tryptophan 2,3-dioxygenase
VQHPQPAPKEKQAQLLEALKAKYEASGQDMNTYLEGLLYADYLSYWDYIHLDTLLSLQNPETPFPDEAIFITYHQITELYFKLILSEMEQIGKAMEINEADFTMRVVRINRYFEMLVQSFDIMGEGMEAAQFRKFRLSLTPASGFQSVQFRMIEIRATEFINLVDKDVRHELNSGLPMRDLYEHIYWKRGATELTTGKKTLTLQKFEEKYEKTLVVFAEEVKETNLWIAYKRLTIHTQPSEKLIKAMRHFDTLVNIDWALAHFKSAMRYLHQEPESVAATGGTNWQQYLPPFFQKRIFYPELWTQQEKQSWGKGWVEKHVLKNKNTTLQK